MDEIAFTSYDFASPEYAQSIALRDELLRRPLGIEFSEDELSEEWTSFHLGGFNGSGRLVACLVLKPITRREIKMRQVAVTEDLQGTGIGAKLVRFAEAFAKLEGYSTITLHARKTVTGFYDRLEYYQDGEEFEEVSIPHLKMKKELVTA